MNDAILSGIASLDLIKGGFFPGELTIIAARPSMGKSAVALNIARNISLGSAKTVAFFSLEMAKEQVLMRLLSMDAGVPLTKIRNGKLNDEAFNKMISSARLASANLHIIDDHQMTPLKMRQLIVRGSRLDDYRKPDLIIVDYLQLMRSDVKHATRNLEIKSILSELKQVAVDFNLPVVVLAQLNRGPASRSDRRPLMSDFEVNSSEADSTILLYRESYHDPKPIDLRDCEWNALTKAAATSGEIPVETSPQSPLNRARIRRLIGIEFHVAKNSFGKTGTARAVWRRDNFEIT